MNTCSLRFVNGLSIGKHYMDRPVWASDASVVQLPTHKMDSDRCSSETIRRARVRPRPGPLPVRSGSVGHREEAGGPDGRTRGKPQVGPRAPWNPLPVLPAVTQRTSPSPHRRPCPPPLATPPIGSPPKNGSRGGPESVRALPGGRARPSRHMSVYTVYLRRGPQPGRSAVSFPVPRFAVGAKAGKLWGFGRCGPLDSRKHGSAR